MLSNKKGLILILVTFSVAATGIENRAASVPLFEQALRVYYDGNYEQSLILLDRLEISDIAEIKLLRLQVLAKLGRVHESLTLLDDLVDHDKENPYLLYFRFQLALQQADYEDAEHAINVLKKLEAITVPLAAMAILEIARHYYNAGELGGAADRALSIAATSASIAHRAEAHEILLDVAIAEKNSQDALKNFDALVTLYSEAVNLIAAEEKFRTLFPAGYSSWVSNVENAVKVSHYFLERNEYARVKELMIATVRKKPGSSYANGLLGLAYYFLYDFGPAIAYLQKVDTSTVTPEFRDKVMFYLARSYQRSLRSSLAREIFKKVIESPESAFLEPSHYHLHKIYRKRYGYDKQSPYLEALRTKFASSSFYNRIVWHETKRFIVERNWRTAYRKLRSYSNESDDTSMQSQLNYWQAKSLRYLKQFDRAAPILQRGIRRYPYSYYTYQTIQRYFPDDVNVIPESQASPLDLDDDLKWLARIGYISLALAILRKRLVDAETPDQQRAALYKLAKAQSLGGDHYRAIWNVRRHFFKAPYPAEDLQIPTEYQTILYPLAYWNEVQEQARKYDIDPFLVMGLMRQESLFKPDIRSRANATGLMQIMPRTGEDIARRLGVRWRGPEMLLEPKVNIQFGCYYLSHLIKQFKGDVTLALSGYNAGPTTTRRWIEKFGVRDIDYFVFRIPYDETQGYVKKVLQSYWIYKRLYKASDPVELKNPIMLLGGDNSFTIRPVDYGALR